MNGAMGQAVSRLDGRAKVTGSARYTADTPIDGVQHAVLVPSTIPHGSVDAIDTATAETSPGVLKVLTIWGYYTSEVGQRQELRLYPRPITFDGCAPYAPRPRATSTAGPADREDAR